MRLPDKIHQVVLGADGQLARVELPLPAVGPDHTLVEVLASSICGTDLAAFGERRAAPGTLPTIAIGHEVAGVVRGGGSLPMGTPVVLDPCLFCSDCATCRAGRTNFCERVAIVGTTTPTAALADFLVAPERALIPIDPSLPPALACLIEPLACAAHGLSRAHDIEPGCSLAVFGAGLLGVGTALLARARGYGDVLVVDPVESRRAAAASLGLAVAVDARPSFEVAVVATSTAAALEQAVRTVRKGGQVVVTGSLPAVALDAGLAFGHQASLAWSLGALRADFDTVLAALSDGMPAPMALTRQLEPDELDTAAFADAWAGRTGRPLVLSALTWPVVG